MHPNPQPSPHVTRSVRPCVRSPSDGQKPSPRLSGRCGAGHPSHKGQGPPPLRAPLDGLRMCPSGRELAMPTSYACRRHSRKWPHSTRGPRCHRCGVYASRTRNALRARELNVLRRFRRVVESAGRLACRRVEGLRREATARGRHRRWLGGLQSYAAGGAATWPDANELPLQGARLAAALREGRMRAPPPCCAPQTGTRHRHRSQSFER